MSHEPGRERHMQYFCEHCYMQVPESERTLNETVDEYWCESCVNNAAEAAYDRQQEANLESPPESSREEQIRTWNEHQQLRKR